MKQYYVRSVLWCFFIFVSSVVWAGSFQVLELGASVMGSANSGTAVSDDMSVQYFNPAAMQNLKHDSVSVNGALIQPVMKFKPRFMTRGGVVTATSGDIKDLLIAVPAFYYIKALNEDWRFGFGVTVPYGLKSEYDKNSAAKYFATFSSLETINFNPSLSYRIGPEWSIGAGYNLQRLAADLNTMFAAGVNGDVNIQNSGEGWGHGWNAGVQYRPIDTMRFGISYRSKVSHNLKGDTRIKGTDAQKATLAGLGIEEGNAYVNTTLPEFAIASMQYDVSPALSLLGDFQYTRWSRIKDISLVFGAQRRVKSITTKYYNTRRYALGGLYRLTPKWHIRAGYAKDQSPVSARYRTARIPDNDRTWYSAGMSYFPNKQWEGHLAFTYVAFRDSSIQENEPLVNHTLIADYSGHANLFSLQLTHHFA